MHIINVHIQKLGTKNQMIQDPKIPSRTSGTSTMELASCGQRSPPARSRPGSPGGCLDNYSKQRLEQFVKTAQIHEKNVELCSSTLFQYIRTTNPKTPQTVQCVYLRSIWNLCMHLLMHNRKVSHTRLEQIAKTAYTHEKRRTYQFNIIFEYKKYKLQNTPKRKKR